MCLICPAATWSPRSINSFKLSWLFCIQLVSCIPASTQPKRQPCCRTLVVVVQHVPSSNFLCILRFC
jgi:hypothetical protein